MASFVFIRIVVAVAMTGATPVRGNHAWESRSSEVPILLSEVLPEDSVNGERPMGANTDLIPFHPDGSGEKLRIGQRKVSCRGCSVSLAGADREPSAEVYFSLHSTRWYSVPTLKVTDSFAGCRLLLNCFSGSARAARLP
ncbi:unnamed protein product [Calypogeia fissa]